MTDTGETGRKERNRWVQPWAWRWRGTERWHRLAIGPLCLSIFPGRQRSRWYVGHSWCYRQRSGGLRMTSSLRPWLQAVRRELSGSRAGGSDDR